MRRKHASDQSAKRRWTRHTASSIMISVRVPIPLADRLREYVDYTGISVTDVVVDGIKAYLDNTSPLEEGGKTEE